MPTTTTTLRPTRSEVGDPTIAEATDAFLEVRRRLLGIAQRVLGNSAEAEDIVQDAWIRWQECDRARVVNPTAFLVTTTSRLAINAAQSARVRHEAHGDQRLLDPVDPSDGPALGAERGEELELGILFLLERLSRVECVSYVLRHGFGRPYRQIAEAAQISEVNARQVVSRAGRRLSAPPRWSLGRPDRPPFADALVSACRRGDVAALEDVLARCALRTTVGGESTLAA